MNRTIAALIAVALAAGFGGGYLTAKSLGHGPAGPSGASTAQAVQGFSWPFFGKPRAASAARPAVPKPDGFAVWTSRIDTSRPDPVACVRMTRPLDPARSYADFVLVSPDLGRQPAVSVHEDELCLGGLGLSDHRVTLLKGLPAKTGEALAANADVDFTASEKPAYVAFAGDGVILPREEADGVGIETVSVSKLAVEVWRVADRNLVRKEITAPAPTAEGEYAEDYGDDSPDDEGVIVWKGEVKVVPANGLGQRTTTVFPLGAVLKEMKPGGYVIKARDASSGDPKDSESRQPAQARRWIMFTDMALTAYDGSDGLDAVVRSLKTARAMVGIRVALVAKNGEDLGVVTSGPTGRVRFPRPMLDGEGAGHAKMLMAYGSQGDLAVLDLDRSPVDLSNQGTGGRNAPGGDASAIAGREAKTAIDGYLYADRGIYRPGETIHLVAMVRDRQAKAVNDRKGELVLRRPSGVEFTRLAFDRAEAGVVARDITLPKSAPRGRWNATLEIDGLSEPSGAISLSVEDFAPQRLAVTAKGDAERPVAAGEARKIDVNARFLYGAPGAGLQVQGEARLRADRNPFPQFKDYRWGDELAPFEEKAVDLTSTVTDGEGHAVLSVDSEPANESKAPVEAAVVASVFEPGGRPVRQGLTLKLRPQPLYLGVKIDQDDATSKGAPVTVDIIAVDGEGRRTSAGGVTWTLIAENWDYDWYQQDGTWKWRRTNRDVVVASGGGDVGSMGSLHIAKRLGWGDYRLVVEGSPNARTVTRFAAGWGASAKEAEAPDFVRVSAGTRNWTQGDTVEVAIKAPYPGEAQVAVATDRLIDFQTLSVGKNGATVRLKTSAAWGGGAYVLVSVIQPRDPSVTPKPRRALGLIYVPLDPGKRKLTVDLATPARIDSKAFVDVPLTVHGLGLGQRAHVTVAAVDEGILQLTKQESPDPAKWYFGKRALSVNYRDDYGRLLDPNLGAPAALNYGGDELGGEGLTTTPIKTVALWSGVVETGAGGKAVVRLPAADFNGEVRIMAVAWTDDAVGSASKPMTVRQPVIADLNLPRFLAPGDLAQATLELHNLEGKAGQYLAQITADGGLLAPFRKLFDLVVGQRIAEHAPLRAPSVSGVGHVHFKVTGPGFVTVKDYPLQTRLGWDAVTRVTTEPQKPGETYSPSPALMSGLAAGSVTMHVSYSPFRGFDPAAVALSLSRYPYGCTEQLVSIAYPLLYAAEMTSDPKVRRSSAALNDSVGKLLDRQSLDGAFGLWRVGDGEADPWLGAFATDFLVEAKAQGAPIPDAAMDRALTAMRQISRPEGFASVSYRMEYPGWWMRTPEATKAATGRLRSRASAYALYVLAKAGQGDLARLRWWHDVQMKNEASPLAKAQVAAGLAMMGDRARARDSLIQAIRSLGYKEETDWYQSPLRDLAGVIAYAYEAGEPAIARTLQGRLDGSMRDPDRLNTQEQSRLLQAAHAMLRASGPIRITATGVVALPPAAGAPRWAVGKLVDARFANAGTGVLWRTVTVRGVPTSSPAAESQGISVSKSLWTMAGGRANPASLAQGQRVIVEVSGVSGQERSVPLVVDDALPAGWEIETVLGPDDALNAASADKSGPYRFLGVLTQPSAQESRDDRYVAAMDLQGGKRFAFAYVVRAVTPGDFYLPGAEARDMYRPGVSARSAGGRVVIAAGP